MTRVRARPIAQTSGALALLKNISPAACFNTPQGESQGLSGDSHQDGRWERKAKLMKALRQAQREMHASNGQGKRKDRLTNYFLIYDSQGVWSGPGCWEEHRIAQSWIRLSFVIETLKDFTLLPHIKPISDTISRQSGIFKLTAEGAICRRILPNGRGREFSQILYVTDDPQCPDIVAGDDFMRAMMGVDDDDGDETDSEVLPDPEAQTHRDLYARPTLYYRLPHPLQLAGVADPVKDLTDPSGSSFEGSATQRSLWNEVTPREEWSTSRATSKISQALKTLVRMVMKSSMSS